MPNGIKYPFLLLMRQVLKFAYDFLMLLLVLFPYLFLTFLISLLLCLFFCLFGFQCQLPFLIFLRNINPPTFGNSLCCNIPAVEIPNNPAFRFQSGDMLGNSPLYRRPFQVSQAVKQVGCMLILLCALSTFTFKFKAEACDKPPLFPLLIVCC